MPTFSFGTPTVTLTQPAVGFASTAVFGGAPVVVPTGFAATAAFGTPTVTSKIPAIGFTAATSFGVGPPVAIPEGFAAAISFGTPTVVLSASSVVSAASIPGGLARARRDLDDLIEFWWKLQKKRKRLLAEQERLARSRAKARRERLRTVVDLGAERRLDKLIAAANQALFLLQEHEDEVYAGVRATLLDVQGISTENRRALHAIERDYQALLHADDEDAILALM